MRIFVVIVIVMFNLKSVSQNIDSLILKLNKEEDLVQFHTENRSLRADIFEVNGGEREDRIDQILQLLNPGDTCTLDGIKYKILSTEVKHATRIQYIYLNGSTLTLNEIEKRRKTIISEYKNGTPFADLVSEYNMDRSNGDLGWFDEYDGFVTEFVTAAKSHKKGDIFTLDLTIQKWYYVILKTHDDRDFKRLSVVRIKRR